MQRVEEKLINCVFQGKKITYGVNFYFFFRAFL